MMHPEEVSFDPKLPKSVMKATIVKIERGGAVVTYLVSLGMFSMYVVVLHVNYSARNKPRTILRVGTFGDIVQLTGTEHSKVFKRIKFRGTKGSSQNGNAP